MKLELFLEKMYEKNYKRFIFISLGLLVLSLVILGINYASKGSVIERDISLKGGISITIEKESLDEQEISSYLNEKFANINVRTLTDLSSRKSIGLIINNGVNCASNRKSLELSEKFKAKNMITGENSLISIVKFK